MIIVSKYSLEEIKISFKNKDDFRIELICSSEGKKVTDIKNKKSLKDDEILKYIPKLFSKIHSVKQQPSLRVAEKAKEVSGVKKKNGIIVPLGSFLYTLTGSNYAYSRTTGQILELFENGDKKQIDWLWEGDHPSENSDPDELFRNYVKKRQDSSNQEAVSSSDSEVSAETNENNSADKSNTRTKFNWSDRKTIGGSLSSSEVSSVSASLGNSSVSSLNSSQTNLPASSSSGTSSLANSMNNTPIQRRSALRTVTNPLSDSSGSNSANSRNNTPGIRRRNAFRSESLGSADHPSMKEKTARVRTDSTSQGSKTKFWDKFAKKTEVPQDNGNATLNDVTNTSTSRSSDEGERKIQSSIPGKDDGETREDTVILFRGSDFNPFDEKEN